MSNVATPAPAASTSPVSGPTSSAPNKSTPSSAPTTPAAARPSTPTPAAAAPSSAPVSDKPGDIAAAAVGAATGEGTPAADAAAPQAQQPKVEPPKTYKVKVNGEVRDMTEEQLLRYASLGGGADAKFQEAKQMREAAEQLVTTLRENPLAVLTHPDMGINFRELAEHYLAGEIKREMLPPEQRELEELRSWRQQQEAAARQQQQEQVTRAQQEQLAKLQQKAAAEYDAQITDALSKSDLPRRAETIRDVAAEMYRAMEMGYEIDVPTAVAMVRDRYSQTIQTTLGGLDGEALVKVLGNDIANKIRKYDIARLRARQDGAAAPTPAPIVADPPASKPAETKHMTRDQWAEYIRKKAGI